MLAPSSVFLTPIFKYFSSLIPQVFIHFLNFAFSLNFNCHSVFCFLLHFAAFVSFTFFPIKSLIILDTLIGYTFGIRLTHSIIHWGPGFFSRC
jgi:hypothetical protein